MTRAGRAVAAVMAVLALTPAAAWAHASLVKASPAARAVVSRSPARAQLWFNERLEALYSHLSVIDAQGGRVDLGDVQVGPDDPKKLSVGLPALAPGVYTVRFRVLSVDGHIVESQFTFTVRASP
jgi:methionine-rich copper-binding protein CopC